MRRSSIPTSVEPDDSRELWSAIAGAAVREVGLPRNAIIAVVDRNRDSFPPRGSTIIEPGDRLFVLAPRAISQHVDDVFARWRRRV